MVRTLVTGSSGHLGEAIVRTLRARGEDVAGMDIRTSPWTDRVGSVTDPAAVRAAMTGADVVLHTATLHKPQLAFVPGQAFIETNVSGTLSLLEAAVDSRCARFCDVFFHNGFRRRSGTRGSSDRRPGSTSP